MSALAHHRYVKMNGLGNEIVIVDLRGASHPVSAAEVQAIHRAVGFDQLMAIHSPNLSAADGFVRIFNNDGSEAGACGNGMRCVAEFLFGQSRKADLMLETRAGLSECRRAEGALSWTVDMGAPRFGWQDIPLSEPFHDTRAIELEVGPVGRPVLHSPSAVSMGNPHAVFWVEDVDAHDLGKIGPMLECHPLFPERANISLAQVLSRDRLKVRTWERGAGLTRACGTAACASLVSAARTRRTGRHAAVMLPGGDLAITWRDGDGHVLMTGPVAYEQEGRLDPALFAGAEPTATGTA
jgi:diaminopimelate epimerase